MQPHESKGPQDFEPTVKQNSLNRNDVTEDEDEVDDEDSSSADEVSVKSNVRGKPAQSRRTTATVKRASTSSKSRPKSENKIKQQGSETPSEQIVSSQHSTPSSQPSMHQSPKTGPAHHVRRGTDMDAQNVQGTQQNTQNNLNHHRYSRSQGSINIRPEAVAPDRDSYDAFQYVQDTGHLLNQQQQSPQQHLNLQQHQLPPHDLQPPLQLHQLHYTNQPMQQSHSQPPGDGPRYLRSSESPQTDYKNLGPRHQMFAVPPPQRPQSVDVTPSLSRAPGDHSLRPKLKVQIPLGETSEGISSSEKSRDKNDRDSQPATSSAPGSAGGPHSSSAASQLSGGGAAGGSWGSAVLLPPPSPSSFLTVNNSASGVGPGNPFGRPPLVNNGEQTPLSAAIPSKYVNDLLPSPSNFYGSEWNIHFGTGQTPTSATAGAAASSSSSGHANVGMGISLNGGASSSFSGGYRSHLSNDMLPSPLQFNTPVVASSSASLLLGGSPIGEKKRDNAPEPVTSSSKRFKLNRQ